MEQPTPQTPLELRKMTTEQAADALGVVFHPVLRDPALTQAKPTEKISSSPALFGSPIHENNASHIGVLRTYRGDIEETIKSQNVSAVSIAVAENNRRISGNDPFAIENHTENKKNTVLIFLSIFLVVVGILFVGFSFFFNKTDATPAQTLLVPSLISPETQKEVSFDTEDRGAVSQILRDRVDKDQIRANTIEQLYFSGNSTSGKKLLTAQQFIALTLWNTPDQLTRSLSDEFMFGIHSFTYNQPFLILKTNSYENAFAGMLAWEQTLPRDLALLFGLPTTASSTIPFGSLSKNTGFTDMVIRNKDTRVFAGTNGTALIYYSFSDKNTIVITTNEYTLKEVLLRLSRVRVTQ